MTIYQVMKKTALAQRQAVAYEYFDEKGTYEKLLAKTNIFAKHLAKRGIKKGDSVAICLPNCPAMMYALFATNAIGARAVMLNPKSPAVELRRQLVMTKAKAFIFSSVCAKNVLEAVEECEELKKIVFFYSKVTLGLPVFFKFACLKKLYPFNSINELDKIIKRKCVCMDNLSNIPGKINVATDDEADAVAIFSSGTGGEYKVIVHSSKSLNNSSRSCEDLVAPYPKNIRMLAVLPSFHMFGLAVAIYLPIHMGGSCVLVPFFHINTIAKMVARECPHFLVGVPTIFKRLYECGILQKYEKRGKLNFKDFVWGFCGGDYLATETREAFNDLIKRNGGKGYISMGYGMSECCPVAVADKYKSEEKCVGKPLLGCEVKICDVETGEPMEEGMQGEVCLYSDYLMKKYFYENREEHYPLIDENGNRYIKTGDIGFMKDGKLYYEYRMRRIIKVSGNTIFAGYVEEVIKKHPKVKECIVVPIKHETRGNSTFAFVVSDGEVEQEELTHEIIALCKKELIPYAIPAGVEYCEAGDIKMTVLGKVVYGELENKALDIMNKR